MALGSINEFFKEENDSFFRRGYAKGHQEEKKAIAVKMKKSGLEVCWITNITGLSVEEIEKL